jgi:hypothetical protein
MAMGQPQKNKEETFTSDILAIIKDVVKSSDYMATRWDE